MILALENSLHLCSLALADRSGQLLAQKEADTQTRHSETLLACIDEFFSEQTISPEALSALVYGRGPGSFTSVRIVAAISHAIALTQNIPVYTASSLSTLAFSAPPNVHVLSILDARLSEVYWAAYRRDQCGLVALMPESVSTVNQVADWIGLQSVSDWLVLGDGGPLLAPVWPTSIARMDDFERTPLAHHLLPLVDWNVPPPEGSDLPVYLKADRPWRKF